MSKHYKIEKKDIKPLATGHGLCVATDLITVEGQPIGYMVREEPEDDQDSGWRFFTGNEDDRYIDNPKNFSLLDVNVLANYDPSIIPLLDSPIGAAFDKGDNGVYYDANED
ncbi:DUF2185 domain-containing protein [Parachitinimonas caeni]|uniref:DUF2185 domain-containing protein n=1 Tax=Parachitinimonas caeni TaxID=3031301 RepID=A0ABT7E0L2_9NEIS|nr:DUF2185 domain-containing protein [Parachitinimonas caeni]MDK2125836.1 DUF2185 domain-containing protein [Parachitinimonas caeni]